MIASARDTSSFSSPVRSLPNRIPTPLPIRQAHPGLPHGVIRPEDALHLPALRGAVVAKTKWRSATASRAFG